MENQRGYELVSRMSAGSEFGKRIALCSADGTAVAWNPAAASAPRKERGMSLPRRMMESQPKCYKPALRRDSGIIGVDCSSDGSP